jgi:hypothetical protein
MASKNARGQDVSVEEQTDKHVADAAGERAVDADGAELRPSVEQEIQGTVDTKHPDAGVTGLTLAAEERLAARELEIERTAMRWDRRQDSDREARCRKTTAQMSDQRRVKFDERAAAVNQFLDPMMADPREQLSQAELGTVNREAARMAETLDGWSRAALSRRLAERVLEGGDVASAVVGVSEELRTGPGQVIPIGKLEGVNRTEVSIEGTVTTLWDSDSPAIQQVGLLEDESGRTKLTSWTASNQPWIAEGERVRIQGAARNWYQGRVSVALTGWSTVQFPERDRWWE